MSTEAGKPEVLAEHLETKVWNNRALPNTPLFPGAYTDTGPFTEQQLMTALSRSKNRRAPGPDQTPRGNLEICSPRSP